MALRDRLSQCFSFEDEMQDGCTVWLAGEGCYSVFRMTKGLLQQTGYQSYHIVIVRPMVILTSVRLIAQYYTTVQAEFSTASAGDAIVPATDGAAPMPGKRLRAYPIC